MILHGSRDQRKNRKLRSAQSRVEGLVGIVQTSFQDHCMGWQRVYSRDPLLYSLPTTSKILYPNSKWGPVLSYIALARSPENKVYPGRPSPTSMTTADDNNPEPKTPNPEPYSFLSPIPAGEAAPAPAGDGAPQLWAVRPGRPGRWRVNKVWTANHHFSGKSPGPPQGFSGSKSWEGGGGRESRGGNGSPQKRHPGQGLLKAFQSSGLPS